MPKTRLISPGSIPNHKLLKNLQLQDNYISNDGGDEGIRITDTGLVGIGTSSPGAALDVEKTGTAKSNLDIVELTNNVNAADMDGTETSILFNQWAYDGSSPAVQDAARITVGTTADWTTATAATQDSYMAFHIARNGTVSEKLRIVDDAANTKVATIDGDLILEAEDDIIINSEDGNILFQDNGSAIGKIYESSGGSSLTLYESPGGTDSFSLTCLTHGATTMGTIDASAQSADLTLDIDGAIKFQAYGYSGAVAEASGKKITIIPGTEVLIDKDLSHTTASTLVALHVDLDRTGTVSSGTDTATGIDLDVNQTGASGGTTNAIGMDIDVVGETSTGAVSTAVGLDITVGSADTNYALLTSGGNVGIGETSPTTPLAVSGAITIKEQASAPNHRTGYGMLWVDDASPSALYFTNDAGNDIQLTTAGLLSPSSGVAADDITEGNDEVSIGTSSAHDIIFTDTNSAEFFSFNTSDVTDGAGEAIAEILVPSAKKFRIRTQSTQLPLQITSAQNVDIAHRTAFGVGWEGTTVKAFRTTHNFTITTAEWDVTPGLDDGTGQDPAHVRHAASTHTNWGLGDDPTAAYSGAAAGGRIHTGMFIEGEDSGLPWDPTGAHHTTVVSVASNTFFQVTQDPTVDALDPNFATINCKTYSLRIFPTMYKGTLQAPWKVNQTYTEILQVGTQNATTIPAQVRGSTSGQKCVITFSTTADGIPEVDGTPVMGGNGYTNLFTDNTCDFNHSTGLDTDGTTGGTNLISRSTIVHNDDDGAIKLYMSVEGTGIPVGCYVGEVDVNHLWFRIHKGGGTGAIDTAARCAVSATVTDGTLTFRDRICFQDPTDSGAGGTDNHMVLEVQDAGDGTIGFGRQTAAQAAVGYSRPKIILDFNEARSVMFLTDRLRIIGSAGGVFQTDVNTVFLSGGHHTAYSGQDYTFIHGGDRMFLGSTSCNNCSIFIDSTTSTRRLWLAASTITNGLAKEGSSDTWEGAGGLELAVTNSTGAVAINSRHKTGGDNKAAHMQFEANGNITLKPQMEMKVLLEKLYVGTTNDTPILQDLVYTITGDTGGGQTISHIAHNITMDATADDGAGTGNFTGIDVNVTADATTGTKHAKGIDINTSGGDTNIGLQITNPTTALNDTHIKLIASADADDYALIKLLDTGDLFITTVGDGTTDSQFNIDADGPISLDSANGAFITKNNGAEFSVANSAYAGMIIGYTVDGINQTPATYSLTTSEALVASSTHHVSFVAPPSTAVEIEVHINYDGGTGGILSLGLSDNTTIGLDGLADYLLQQVYEPSRNINDMNIVHKWVVTGLTAGITYKWYLTAKTHNTGGTPALQWGGDSAGENPLFIMKATALPTAVLAYAIYS